MRMIWMAIILLGAIAQAKVALCQCGEAANLCKCIDPPRLSIKSNTIVVSGQIVHLSGKLPSEDEHWFYSVTCHTSSRLFNFSLWAILKFQDRDGYYLAKSWNLQILDSTVAPETEIIFDKENKFYFWGKVTHAPGGEKIRIDSIVGLPEGIHGEGLLSEVQQEIVPRSTTRH